jgi:hypothetical protein
MEIGFVLLMIELMNIEIDGKKYQIIFGLGYLDYKEKEEKKEINEMTLLLIMNIL